MNANGPFEIVDLSVQFHSGMPKYHASWFPSFEISEIKPESMPEASWKRRFTTLALFAHNGTHVEGPDHAFRNEKTICQYDLRRFVGNPVILDLSHLPDATRIDVNMIKRELLKAPFTELGILLIHTGYNDRAWGKPDFWERSPYLDSSAAAFIASLSVRLIGLDFQTEKPGECEFIIHKTLLSHDILLCEYLVNIGKLRPDCLFLAVPISIRNVEASPVRAIGINPIS